MLQRVRACACAGSRAGREWTARGGVDGAGRRAGGRRADSREDVDG